MRKHIIVLSLLFCLASQTFSNNKTTINQLALISKQALFTPFAIDSTDVNGAKYKISKQLDNYNIPTISSYSKYTILNADTADVFKFEKPEQGSELYYLEFMVYAQEFCKPKLHVSSTSDFRVFIDANKKDGSASSKLGLAKATEKAFSLDFIPEYYRIGISFIVNSNDTLLTSLKVGILGDSLHISQVAFNKDFKRKLGYEDVINVSAPTDASLSYSGDYILNKVSTILPEGEKKSYLEVLSRKTQQRVLYMTNRMDVQWMPKSDKLYFVEKEGKNRILYSLDPITNETTILSNNIPEGTVYWSPDEKFLIISSSEKYNDTKSDFKYYILPQDRMANWRNGSSLSRFDLETGDIIPLTFSNKSVNLNDISEDGSKIIFSVSEPAITQRPFSTSSFFQYDFTNNKVDSIWLKNSFVNSVKYSPDAKQLLVFGAPSAFNKLGENIGKQKISNSYDVQAYIYDFATKKVKAITKFFDPTINAAQWNKADNMIYFRVSDRDYARVYQYNVQAEKFELLSIPVDVVQQFEICGSGHYAGVRGMGASYPTRSYVYDLQSKESILVCDPEKQKMSELALGDVIDYNYKAKDGGTIYGRYYLPSDFDNSKTYPMIVYYYGGTTPTQRVFSANWNYHFWASMGYVVYVVQPSGAIGFGQEFSARHVNAWGDRTADDIIQGVKNFTKSHKFVDPKKVGCLGASYGGFMTMYLQTKTDIFATAISHAGISALSSYWGNGYWGYGYSGVATADTYPWNNPKYYTEHSPLFYADKINTPLLLIQGEDDTNVPPGESMQMFTALKILGKEVALVRVKSEDHVIADYKHKKEWNYTLMAWMSKYLQNNSSWWENLYPEAKDSKK